MVQWLRLRAPNTGGLSSILDQGTGSHMPKLRVLMLQLKNLNAATKVEDPATKAWCSQINIKEKKKKYSSQYEPNFLDLAVVIPSLKHSFGFQDTTLLGSTHLAGTFSIFLCWLLFLFTTESLSATGLRSSPLTSPLFCLYSRL